ncbi:bifunctional DNA-formamidopyrimidine glycosylase/DNA-(apurinic or apyrimidinic site) lyase [Trueperella bialowiezensis]|uniref:Formamidopyrimidine-DNA glycosylase n=1 Tax=Trueperella bialowiezensis TaxID=312285 RepID=A0A3S4VUK7_9ACTO|nr:bifunctional DNA-formamidopyrimidine glycosylase/DNA-(apurinic or apyrimidinic site) lyase [Trueperella bialowiezensis]VEI14038.1 Formamidopyrimidine-DNA glycosylase [Trueperella bialowiezensis]
MPELPEVETIRQGLEAIVTGRTIREAHVLNERAARRAPAGLAPVVGRQISGVVRRGKYMWFDVGEHALVAHLGMSGQFRIDSGDHPHVRVRFVLDDGVRLDFLDQRTFGHLMPDTWALTDDGHAGGYGSAAARLPQSVAHIGRDPLDPAFDLEAVVRRVKAKRTEIKRVLLDQTVASGIGNIYADEALFTARVHPRRATNGMALAKIREVYEASADVMERALAAGGTSFDTLYVNVNGESGYFERALQAYGRTGKPCQVCATPIKRETFMNRSSHFCPRCQRPRGVKSR